MDKNDALRLTKAYISKVMETLPVRSAWLYGSWVYGIPDKESDIDVAILLDDMTENILETEKKLQYIRRTSDMLLIEPVIIEPENDHSGFSDMIIRQGEQVYP